MIRQLITLKVSDSAGNVSGEYVLPDNPSAMFTLAHGAGAGMNHPFMVALANALSQRGIGTLRFNFPFIEQKKKRPDLPAVAHKTIAAAINEVRNSYPQVPLIISGKSFGGRMSSQYASTHPEAHIRGIVFFGFPLHPAGKPSTERADHLQKVKVPMLFVQGTRDELATLELIEQVSGSLPNATLIKIEGADHAFKAGKQDVISMLADHAFGWTNKLLALTLA